MEEKENRFREKPEITAGHAGQEEPEADEDRREKEPLLDRGQRRQNELREEIKEERKGEHDPGIKGEMKRDRDRVGDPERAQGADLAADFTQRPLQDRDQPMTKGKAEKHRDDQHDRHFHDRPAQVLEVLEERLRGFALGRIAKGEDVAQFHQSGENLAARHQPRPDAERIGVANFAVGNHLAHDVGAEFAAIDDRLRGVVLGASRALFRTGRARKK